MFIERVEDHGLSQYSYIIGCEAAAQAIVVDPRRDVDVYLPLAASRGVQITHVVETHIHADFASGARELAHRTGAALSLSAYDVGERYEVAFPHVALRDGDTIEIGSVRMRAVHTPGHTPEHLSYLVFDTARSDTVPMTICSGDFLFVGSLGRPDLLGDEEKWRLAELLWQSVRRALESLPDGLEVAPGHGAGSMCGSGIAGRAVSTLGFERIANPYLGLSEPQFLDRILSNVPPFPPYYRRMKSLNAKGPALLGGLPGQTAIPATDFRQLVDEGHVVIDLREQLAFGAGHVPGAFGIASGPRLSTLASWFVPYDTPLLLVAPDAEQAAEATRALIRVGLDDVRGFLADGIDSWIRTGLPLAQIPQISAGALHRMLSAGEPVHVVDVRERNEWEAGHIGGAHHVPPGDLVSYGVKLQTETAPVVVICASGYRSTAAASVLARAGLGNLLNLTGGLHAWTAAGLAIQPARR